MIVRDLNGFWITFGQELPADALTPWPPAGSERLQPYAGRYESAAGAVVLITIYEGRLLAFPEDGPGVFLRPTGEQTFTPMMPQQVSKAAGKGAILSLGMGPASGLRGC